MAPKTEVNHNYNVMEFHPSGISDPEPSRVVKGDDMSLQSDSSPTAESSGNSSQLGPVEIIRAEFTKGNRPVIGSPIWPYVLVREVPSEAVEGLNNNRRTSIEAANEQLRQAVTGSAFAGVAKTWDAGENDQRVPGPIDT
ncbi:hypothetical protein Pmar_PMAR012854 [Perkinsus marinus ATCC 50983]|uniref:Uncharacterized protein n=1 Tax=Perkinsus marinus (strain ATCC 50983 / TXsc) TaxID=423536 RepID=C5L8M1_PERM5|nr:hypothetical protein Pmar_PMAR012854 [Perkinsus marinus ATCC 50983]EER06921.1 hypothetical protein Pmar_PMAR012854 [Perkinsus marinus ATCC 50983]|eukprot:XP_002775105.1 hypothetical protein Pmar_PMAR012854 [Perkinsus marinus ATCC 50983]